MGITELLSVPYALYAATAGNSGGANLNLTGTGSTTVTGDYPNYTINGGYQYLKSSNDTIYLVSVYKLYIVDNYYNKIQLVKNTINKLPGKQKLNYAII